MQTVTAAVTGLYSDCARRLAGFAYLVTGHERVAGRVTAEAFGNAGLRPGRVAAWPGGPESWVRSELLRVAERPHVRLRLLSLPAARDPRDTPLVFALADLPPQQRAALVLHHLFGLDAAAVALETEATVGATVARIRNGEAALAAADLPAAELAARLRGAASRAEVPLPTPASVAALPRRRTHRAVALAGAGVIGLAFSPALADGLTDRTRTDMTLARADLRGDALRTALGQEERVRQEARVRAFEARGIGDLPVPGPVREAERWTPGQDPEAFLPHRTRKPDVTRPERPGRATAFVERAFVHDGRLFVAVERAAARRHAEPGADVPDRVYRVRNRAKVTAGSDLRAVAADRPAADRPAADPGADAAAARMPLAQYLWLVQQQPDASDTPVVLHYDRRGRITRIADAGTT